MWIRASLQIVFLLLSGASAGEGPKFGKYVAKYTEEKFKYVMNKTDRPGVLLEIYSPSCPACKAFAPKLAKAASLLREKLPEVKVVAVDGKADDSTIMEELKVDEFPTVMYFPKGAEYRRGTRIPFADAQNVDKLVELVQRLTGPAVVKLTSAGEIPKPEGGKGAHMVLVSPTMVPAYESLAEEKRLAYRWFWLQDESSEEVVSMMMHRGQPAVNYTWADAEADSLDEDAERFEEFIKSNSMPELLMVSNPYQLMKDWDRSGDAHTRRLLWVVLNGSAALDVGKPAASDIGIAPCGKTAEGSCSASSSSKTQTPKKSPEEMEAALDGAMEPYKSIFQQVAKIQKNGDAKKAHTILYVDINRYPEWVQENLYIWHAPALISQRSVHGDKYLFSEETVLPSTSAEVLDWLKKVASSQVPARPKSERPVPIEQAQDHLWKQVSALDIETVLRSAPASLLYSWKSSDTFTSEEEKLQIEDDIELLSMLGEWLNKTCESPPPMLRLDVRKNQVPLGLYAAASIGTLSAPNLYFVHNDAGKKRLGIAWSGNISEYRKQVLDSAFTSKKDSKGEIDFSMINKPKGVFANGVKDVASWVLEQAGSVEGLKVVDSIQGLGEQAVVQGVIDVDTGPQLKSLVDDKSKVGFVEFYSPDCGACKQFKPVYESAARKSARELDTPATFARVDCSTSEHLCNQYGVDSYPTIIFFKDGKTSPYGGGRGRDSLLRYLDVEAAPAVLEVETESEAREIARTGNRPTLLWLGPRNAPGGKVDSRFEAVLATATDWKHVVQLIALPSDQAKEKGHYLELVFPGSKIEPKKFESGKGYSQDRVATFIAEMTVKSEPVPTDQEGPVLVAVGRNFREAVYGPLRDGYSVMVEVYAPWCGHCKELAPIYESFAQRMKDEKRKIIVYKFNGDANQIPFDGFDYKGFPSIFFVTKTGEVEKVQARTLTDLIGFVNQKGIEKGSAKPKASEASKSDDSNKKAVSDLLADFKSEPVPTKQTYPVLTLVLKNFLDIVFQEGKSCVFMVYAKSCGHCKALKEPFNQFAEEMAHRQDLVVARMDGEANDLPVAGFQVKGYPTIFYVAKGSKEPTQTFTGTAALLNLRHYLDHGQSKRDEL